jgi:carbon-monoxide dehydrogenase medium subunit
MMNTHILTQDFEYLEPKTVEEALDYLAKFGKKAKVIAGGTDLLVQMKLGKIDPEVIINIARIPGLRYLIEEKGIRTGALTTFKEIENSRTIQANYTALYEAARSVSSVQIRSMGTLGGNLCNSSPAADSAIPFILFGGKVRIAEKGKERIVLVEDFFSGPGQNVLSPQEILIEIEMTAPPGETGSSFLKMGRVSADLAKVSVGVSLVRKGDLCKDCRIALGAVSKTPMRAKKGEELLRGKKLSQGIMEAVCREVSEEIQPITDIRSEAWYRKEISRVLVRDAIRLAWERAGGKIV